MDICSGHSMTKNKNKNLKANSIKMITKALWKLVKTASPSTKSTRYFWLNYNSGSLIVMFGGAEMYISVVYIFMLDDNVSGYKNCTYFSFKSY